MTRRRKINEKLLLLFLSWDKKPDYEALSRQFNCSPNYLMRLKGQYEKQGLLTSPSSPSNFTYHILSDILGARLFPRLLTITKSLKSHITKGSSVFPTHILHSFDFSFNFTLTKSLKEVSLCQKV
jgi:hypothetical protein